MKHFLPFFFILFTLPAIAQLPYYENREPNKVLYEKTSMPKNLDTVYYPFYNDIQMIKIADPLDSYYFPTFIKANHFYAKEDVFPIYLFRNKSGKIIHQYNLCGREVEISKLKKIKDLEKFETHDFRFKHTKKYENKYWGKLGFYAIYEKVNLGREFATLCGIIDTSGNRLLEPIYEHIEHVDSIFIVTRGEKFGLLNGNFQTVSQIVYDEINFENKHLDLLLVRQEDKWGMIDKENNILIPIQYDYIAKSKFQPHLYEIRLNGEWQFFNPYTKKIQESKFKTNNVRMRDGQLLIYDGDWNMVDTNGNFLVKSKFEITEMVNENRFLIMEWKSGYSRHIIDKNGNIINEKEYYYLNKLNSSTLLGAYDVKEDKYLTYGRPSKYVLLDVDGNVKSDEVYDSFEKLNANYYSVWKNKKIKVVNDKGKEVLNFPFESIGKMNEHYFLARNKKKVRFIYLGDDIRVSEEFDQTLGLSEGMISVQKYKEWGFLDSNFNLVVPIVFETVTRYKDGMAEVVLDGKKYVINKKGENFAQEKYDSHEHLVDEYVKVKKDGKYGIINTDGNIVISIIYDKFINMIKNNNQYFIIAQKDGMFGIINEKHEIIHPFIFQKASELSVHVADEYNRRHGFYAFCTIEKRTQIEYYYFNFNDEKSYIKKTENYTKGFKKVSKYDCGSCPGNKFGIENWEGKLVVPMIYDGIGDLKKNTFQVSKIGVGGGLIDTTGKVLIPIGYQYLYDLAGDNDFIRVGKHQSTWGLYTYSGKMIADTNYGGFDRPIFNLIPFYADFKFHFVKGKGWEHGPKKMGLMDFNGNIIIEPVYDKIQVHNEKKKQISLRCGNQNAIIDETGKLVEGQFCSNTETDRILPLTKKELRKEKRKNKKKKKKKKKNNVRWL